jgi:hypothetical protein
MSKRRGQDSRSQGHVKRSRRPEGKKHLYLVVDDWEKGYSIRRIDPDTMLPDSDDSACTGQDPTPLPEPPAFRFVAAALDTQFAATGNNIVVVSRAGCGTAEAPTLVYDTGAAALAVAPPLPGDLAGPILTAAGGDALYALTTLGAGLLSSLEAFSWARCTCDEDEPGRPTHEWSWKTVAAAAPQPPFAPESVVSHAAHPDGRTVFVSTRDDDAGGEDTYSFDAERRGWSWLGAWALPFRGQGHFDRELDAWVGLDAAEPGHVRACQVASRAPSAGPPESDRTEEEVFRRAVDEEEGTRSAATLAYVGGSRFCLVESVARGEDVDDRVVRVVVFGLKFDRKGKLRTTSNRTTSSYVAPNYVPSFSPVAFWM